MTTQYSPTVKGHYYYTEEQKQKLKQLMPKEISFYVKFNGRQEIVYGRMDGITRMLGEVRIAINDLETKGQNYTLSFWRQ